MENRKEDRKSQIIDLTLHLIQEKGYVAFSYDDLAKKLGVTKASIHYHFEKKEDLGIAVCNRLEQQLKDMFYTMTHTYVDLEKKLHFYVTKKAERIKENEICLISALQKDYESLPAHLQEKLASLSRMELTYMIDLFQEAKAKGLLKETVDPVAVAAIFLSCVKGALQYKRVMGNDLAPKMFNQLKDLLLQSQ
ncbi:TetR/AcrR family transcriptional regulator [Brevibacillus migulae]|uniref:TetR/AcrR family transcriptional regulator n=1 Tax=Brevibacillus migulae TaxID=1644114 RepID=UPI00106E548A|nr:TetR/AcrR family transcriptional regulator [Brevibacillus migulae]